MDYNAGHKCWDTYQNTSEQSPPPPPLPQAMLSFDDQTHIYTRKTIYLHLLTLYWGGGGGRWGKGDYTQIVPLKITIVIPNDSLVIFCTVFTSVPTTFDLHCVKVTM